MEAYKTYISEIKTRGQLTIPKKIREVSNLEEGRVVTIIPIGDSVLVTPKRLELDEARRQFRKLLKDSGCTIDELIIGLKEERKSLYAEVYEKKERDM